MEESILLMKTKQLYAKYLEFKHIFKQKKRKEFKVKYVFFYNDNAEKYVARKN